MNHTVTVTPGQIRIASVSLLISTPVMDLYEIDCNSKYPEIFCTGHTMVMLGANERTLRPDPLLKLATEIYFNGYEGDGWTTIVDVPGRYSVRVVLANITEASLHDASMLWDDGS